MKKYQKIFLSVLMMISLFYNAKTVTRISSPNSKIVLSAEAEYGKVFYTISKNNKPIIKKSQLGFTLKDGDFMNSFSLIKTSKSTFDETWKQPWGEEGEVRNHFNELRIYLQENNNLKRKLNIVFRIFNDGVGFRYEFPEQKNLNDFVIMNENTEFNFVDDLQSWSLPYKTNFYEGLYRKMPLSKIDTISTPLTLENRKDLFITIHEANLTNYASLNVYAPKNSTNLKTFLTPLSTGEKVVLKSPSVTPWRTIIIAEKAGDLMTSRLMLNLNEPNKLGDVSWIKPGRYIGIWWGMHMKKNTWEMGPNHGAKTENVLKYIDFASKNHFSGVLVEGWNLGWEDWKNFDFVTPYPDFDIKRITDYAKEKNVKIIGHHETGGNTIKYESQIDSAFNFYNKYGINIVKTGYVGGLLDGKEEHGSQYGINHYRKVIETAAKHHIMIDNHEPAMPTGLQRTLPNLMTQEGVRGQEWDAWSTDGGNPPSHTTVIPFTRGLAGPMDFTPGTFNFVNTAIEGTKVRTTLAKQLALYVVLYSPFQMASDMIENYENQKAFSFITSCPVNWQKTIVPIAKIGEYLTVIRKDADSENWFLGAITNENSRELKLSLDFLSKDKNYRAIIYKDGKDAHYNKNPYSIDIMERIVTSKETLSLQLAEGGGIAIKFEKI